METNISARRPQSRRAAFVAAVLAVWLLVPAAVAAQDLERERDEVEREREELEEDLDVLEASNDEISAELSGLASTVDARRGAVAEAEAEAEAAREAVAVAEAELAAAQADLELLRQAVADMAVASYVHPPSQDLVQAFSAASFSDAIVQRTYLDARAKRDIDLLDLYNEATEVAEARAERLAVTAEESTAAADAAAAELGELQQEQERQQAFAGEVEDRIANKLAEASALEELDAELAAQIEAEEQALVAQLPPDPPVEATSAGPPVTTPTTSGGSGSPTTTTQPTTSTPTTTEPPSTDPPPSVPNPSLTTVQGITVASSIAGNVEGLLNAARAAGHNLGGGGYRSPAGQIATRRANCGTSNYAIYEMPSSQCTPPTAPPGTSMHEQGLAIDFTANGALIRSRSSAAFQWLAEHAGSYGLRNLPWEPWHWSVNGQ